MAALIGIGLTAVAFLFALGIFLYEHRRSPECNVGQPLRARKKQRTIALWTIGRFYQSLQQFDLYCEELEKTSYQQIDTQTDATRPSRADLLRFAQAVLLAAAVDILPFSQGKANLFHFIDAPDGDRREIVSHVLTGPFPPKQILAGANAYRKMTITPTQEAESVAGECVRIALPQLERLKGKGNFSGKEIKLGTTHILGMPAEFETMPSVGDYRAAPKGLPAAITVDLRIVFMRPLLPIIRRFAYRRSQFICHRLSRYNLLIGPQ